MPIVAQLTRYIRGLALVALFATVLVGHAGATVLNLSATLDGAQANAGAGTGSAATGFASVQFDTVSEEISVDLSVQGITLAELLGVAANTTPVHIHLGPPGQNGGIVWDLGFYATFVADGSGFIATANDIPYEVMQGALTSPLSVTQFQQALRDGNTYINIHTTTFPGGEIRGQVLLPVATTSWLLGAGALGLVVTARQRRRTA
ncbi:MAG: CHRD domain-containing protein [Gammaproteobacteria bacterium]|nr:CHRD domain-containing protein [Gammaproteobacteria bacterium]